MELQIFSFVLLLLLIITLRASGGGKAIGQIRIARNAPPIVNCDGLASNGYSEFNIEELVTIGLDGKPEKDGTVFLYCSKLVHNIDRALSHIKHIQCFPS